MNDLDPLDGPADIARKVFNSLPKRAWPLEPTSDHKIGEVVETLRRWAEEDRRLLSNEKE